MLLDAATICSEEETVIRFHQWLVMLPVQAQDSIAQRRPEVAQARGRALLNLRLRDAEGGLLGRTLLALVSNKVHPNNEFHAFMACSILWQLAAACNGP